MFAKQPIYDSENNLYGYEVLYRDSDDNFASISNPKSATLSLLTNYCSGLFEGLSEPYVKIFINLPKALIMSDIFLPIPPDRLVIEILEAVEIDNELLIRISDLKQQGYIFAIDDYALHSGLDQLLPLMNIVKIDVLNLSESELKATIANIHQYFERSPKPILLGEKIENKTMHDICESENISLFQGYFLCRPEIVYGKKMSSNGQNALRLVAALQKEDIPIEEVCDLVSKDVALSYQLLKIVNSPLCRLPKKVTSIQEGVVYLGLNMVKQWAMILTVTEQNNTSTETLRILLERAKLCELIGTKREGIDKESCFTVGLFSGIDLVLEANLEWLLNQISLSKELVQAILNREGEVGEILSMAIYSQYGNFEILEALTQAERDLINFANVEASLWASECLKLCKSSS